MNTVAMIISLALVVIVLTVMFGALFWAEKKDGDVEEQHKNMRD